MKHLFISLFIILPLSLFAQNYTPAPLEIAEIDGSPSTYPYKFLVPSGSLTDNGDNTATITFSASETDPVVGAVNGIVKANGTGTISAASAGTDYLVTETDPTALLSGGTDNIKDTHIDWGTGATQVSADDISDGLTNAIVTLTQEGNFETAYNHSQDNTQAHSDYMLNSGDVATGTYDFGDAVVEIPNGTTGTTDATGESYLDTNGDGGTNFSGEVVQIYTGAAPKYLFPISLPLAATQDNFVPTYDASAKTVQWEAGAAGSGDITSVGDVTSGAAFDGTQGTLLTFYNVGGNATFSYDGSTLTSSKPITSSLTGNVTGNVSGSSGSCTGNAATVTNGVYTTDNLSVLASTTSAQLAGVLSDEVGTDKVVYSDSPVFADDISLHSAGVKLTGDGDGALAILGLGNGFDEDLTINLDDTENTAVVSSSTAVSKIDFGSISLEGKHNSSDGTVGADTVTGGLTFKDGLYTSGTSSSGDMSYADARIKAVSTTHDESVTGTQSITGAGFAPKAVILNISETGASGEISFGTATPSSESCIYSLTTVGTWGIDSRVCHAVQSAGVECYATITTWGADGVTLTWEKGGSPTGTLTLSILFYR